jgi:hypothetical protein
MPSAMSGEALELYPITPLALPLTSSLLGILKVPKLETLRQNSKLQS